MKLNRFLLAAIFGLALAFTLSCSDDGGGKSTAACKSTYRSIEICEEFSGEYAAKYKDEVKEDCEDHGGEYVESCPGKALKCKYDGDDGLTLYIYGNLFKDCEAACKQDSRFCTDDD